MSRKVILGFLVLGLSTVVVGTSEAVSDVDLDGVPDPYDNCVEVANGPLQSSFGDVQEDADGDGYGNACDTDFDQSGYVGLADYNLLWACFGETTSCPSGGLFAAIDVNSDGVITNIDMAVLLAELGAPFDGVSGLICADPTLVTPANGGTDPPCISP